MQQNSITSSFYKTKTLDNSLRRHNNDKYIYIYLKRSTKIYKQLLTDIKEEIDSNTIIVRKFNTPLTSMDRSSRRKVNKERVTLDETLDPMNLIDLYSTFHPNTA